MTIHNKENPSVIRTKLSKQIVVAFRNIAKQGLLNDDVKDSTAYIFFLLKDIQSTIETTAIAWEKRDYWVKADRFRREWQWVDNTLSVLDSILNENKWEKFPDFIASISRGLQALKVKLSNKDLNARNWNGAYKALETKSRFVY